MRVLPKVSWGGSRSHQGVLDFLSLYLRLEIRAIRVRVVLKLQPSLVNVVEVLLVGRWAKCRVHDTIIGAECNFQTGESFLRRSSQISDVEIVSIFKLLSNRV